MRTLSKVLMGLGILSFVIILAFKIDTHIEAYDYYSAKIDTANEKITALENAYGQEMIDNELRTFNDCYSDVASNVFMLGMFTPYEFNLNDSQMKKWISSTCKFYYEKTGIWIDPVQDSKIVGEYQSEFWKHYPISELPDSLIKYWKDTVSTTTINQ